ncbi:MAG: hypothetical protein FGM54_02720 [Chitinophagaceae bacterium]|nr:hypothetical protein [Chitinophagaceae bacterium]
MPALTETTSPPLISIEDELKESIQNQQDLEKQVILHILVPARRYFNQLRIWPSSYLIDCQSTHQSKLLWAENISIMPTWTFIFPYQETRFTLHFEALPKSCSQFDFIEQIPEPGGFEIRNIIRNRTDIYHLTLD